MKKLRRTGTREKRRDRAEQSKKLEQQGSTQIEVDKHWWTYRRIGYSTQRVRAGLLSKGREEEGISVGIEKETVIPNQSKGQTMTLSGFEGLTHWGFKARVNYTWTALNIQ